MKCPRCKTGLLTRTTAGVEVDECPACQGIWFDADELRRVKDETDPDLNWMDVDLWKHLERFRVAAGPVDCPRCKIPLFAVQYGDTGVEIACCKSCRGAWLEAEALERIIDHLSEELLTKDVPDYLRATLREAKELVTGPESFLSEWRDFTTVVRMLQYRILAEHSRLAGMFAEFQAKSQF
jgi:Zn-finger nucleic acid-binding protein